MTPTYIDPRGIRREVVAVDEPGPGRPLNGWTQITFACGHVGDFATHFTYKVGSELFCFKCGVEARAVKA